MALARNKTKFLVHVELWWFNHHPEFERENSQLNISFVCHSLTSIRSAVRLSLGRAGSGAAVGATPLSF